MTQQHIIFLVLAVLAVALLRLLGGRSGIGRLPVRPRELMTKRERIVCGFIEQAIPSARVHAQVSMGAILQPARAGYTTIRLSGGRQTALSVRSALAEALAPQPDSRAMRRTAA